MDITGIIQLRLLDIYPVLDICCWIFAVIGYLAVVRWLLLGVCVDSFLLLLDISFTKYLLLVIIISKLLVVNIIVTNYIIYNIFYIL